MNFYTQLSKRAADGQPVRIGVVGAGKFASMFLSQAFVTPGFQIVGVADIDPEKARQACLKTGWTENRLAFAETSDVINDTARAGRMAITPDAIALIEAELDIVLEITGIPEAGTIHALKAFECGKHVVMVNVEADCLLRPILRQRADTAGCVYSMAYGDQPALIAEQVDWARTVGLQVVCAGKGTRYQPEYHYSTPEIVWTHYGFSDKQVASGDYNAQMFNSFLDGTKSAIEMCAVANACALMPQRSGLQFPPVGTGHLQQILKPAAAGGLLECSGTVEVVASEKRDGTPVENDLRWGVYVVLEAPTAYVQRCFSEYGLKTDKTGRFAALYRPYHFIGLEMGISVASAVLHNEPTGSSIEFNADVAAVAKKDLNPGEILDGEGGYTVYGKLVRAADSLEHAYLPMGLTGGARVGRPVARDTLLTYGDVDLDELQLSFKLRKSMEKGMIDHR
jgi:predicted homoserine dehydrogenase-like protein